MAIDVGPMRRFGRSYGRRQLRVAGLSLLLVLLLAGPGTGLLAGDLPSTNLQGYGIKIFHVESGLYPFVQVYLRSFDQNMQPLVNLNVQNLGLMVAGRAYHPEKKQYLIQSISNRAEACRTIVVIDTSASMKGVPFESTLKAIARFIDGKRPQDQVAIVALADNKDGYELVSNFERDPASLARRLADLEASGGSSRLYDAIALAMQLTMASGAGGATSDDADYAASTSIIVFSDGKDDGSAVSRSDLMTRISNLSVPIPIYSIAYTNVDLKFLKNLQALSKNSFGKFYDVGEAFDRMTAVLEEVQNIFRNDYVVTLRAYLPVDGNEHRLKLGIEYPSGSGKFRYETARFETLEAPPLGKILEMQTRLDQALPRLPDNNPYMANPFAPTLLVH
jgi:Mg-chelatase subunit ChlD